MNIIIHGSTGHMGRLLAETILNTGIHTISAYVSPELKTNPSQNEYETLDELPKSLCSDIIIDFSHHSATEAVLTYAMKHTPPLPVVIATTGQTDGENDMIISAAKHIPVFHSANMSIGIAVLRGLVMSALTAFPDADVEIIETHHNRKLDAPSGTALMLMEAVRAVRNRAYAVIGRCRYGKREHDEVGIHSVRLANVVGRHQVIVGTANETITLTHEAHDRRLFADGAIAAAEYLYSRKQPGLYTMTEMLSSQA